MPTVTEKIALTREARVEAEREFRKALRAGRKSGMSWPQLATASGMSVTHVRYLVENLNERRRAARKGEETA
jgi:hypothetical protein